MKPKVSIIVPIYNVEKFLKRCLNSLVSQTLEEIEIIAVNDGSSDSSLDIVNRYAENDQRIKIIDKDNSGVSDCRNIGISRVKGEYVAFVDSDDWISEGMMETMYNEIQATKSDVIMCSYVREFTDHSKEKKFNLPQKLVYEKNEISTKLHRMLFGPINDELNNPEGLDSLGTVWGKLYNLDLIRKNNIKFIDLNVIGSSEDTLFNIYYFKYVNRAIFLNNPFYHYWRGNPDSITSKYNPNLRYQWLNLFNLMNQFIIENNLGNDYKRALGNRICMGVLGLGLNECSKDNKLSTVYKMRNIKGILNDNLITNAYSNFNLDHFSIHWKLFYFFNKSKMAVCSYLMLRTIEFLRTRI